MFGHAHRRWGASICWAVSSKCGAMLESHQDSDQEIRPWGYTVYFPLIVSFRTPRGVISSTSYTAANVANGKKSSVAFE